MGSVVPPLGGRGHISTFKPQISKEERLLQQLKSFVSEEKQKENLSGNVNAILLVVHNDEYDNQVTGIKHSYEDLITTHLHSKIEGDKCMELFMLKGEADLVSGITKDFQINKKMDSVKLVTL